MSRLSVTQIVLFVLFACALLVSLETLAEMWTGGFQWP